jgi:hypothetical protein
MTKLCFWGIPVVAILSLLGLSLASNISAPVSDSDAALLVGGAAPVADEEAALLVGGQTCNFFNDFYCTGSGCSGSCFAVKNPATQGCQRWNGTMICGITSCGVPYSNLTDCLPTTTGTPVPPP